MAENKTYEIPKTAPTFLIDGYIGYWRMLDGDNPHYLAALKLKDGRDIVYAVDAGIGEAQFLRDAQHVIHQSVLEEYGHFRFYDNYGDRIQE